MPHRLTVQGAHPYCTANEAALSAAERCACFHCKGIYPSAEVTEWAEDRSGRTALCPRCGIDSVLPGNRPEFLDPAFLAAMREHWFE